MSKCEFEHAKCNAGCYTNPPLNNDVTATVATSVPLHRKCIRVLKHGKGESWEGWYQPASTLWNGQMHWSKGEAKLFFYNVAEGGERAWSFTQNQTQQGKLNVHEGGWIPPVEDPSTGAWVPVPPLGSRKWLTLDSYDTEIRLSLLPCGEMSEHELFHYLCWLYRRVVGVIADDVARVCFCVCVYLRACRCPAD